ncbi:uncharacterized protein LOC117293296 [Asterias rubens]|uniref:uncharacterized protein LOC117293296 n=1 Tax=Asterias rubens TaxID=7604 RepID=UPI0014554EBC|nr:uncharacterized protein LOC117293296 [Asterias rubens]
MMCRGFYRGLRYKAQAGGTHPPWNGNGSQQSIRQEDNIRIGFGAAYLNTECSPTENRSAHLLNQSGTFDSLIRPLQWKWDGWRSIIQKKRWESSNGKDKNHTSQDALEWGTALMFSLHLCRAVTAATLPDDSSDGKKKLLHALADKLPTILSKPARTLSLVSQQNKEKAVKVETPQKEVPESAAVSAFDTAMAKLLAVTDDSIGQAHNYLGVQQAQEGHLEKAVQHFTQGSQVGFSKATFNLAVCYEQGRGVDQELEKAADLYQKAAMQGHPRANYNLGVFHLNGIGGVKQDVTLAMKFIHSAAAAGIKQANSYLGIHFLNSTSDKDVGKAASFLQKAVKKQDTEAQYHLGLCYEHGWGVPMNTAMAASLYHKAAQSSHPVALHSLARFHEMGLGGLPTNREQALELYEQASQGGHQPASEYIQKLKCTRSISNTQISNVNTDIEYKTKSLTHNDTLNVSKTTELTNSEFSSKTLHMSVSAPSLQRSDQATDVHNLEDQQLNYKNKTFSISNLNLLLPYYFNLPSRVSLKVPSEGQSSQVMFQVGGDDEKSSEDSRLDDGAFSIAGKGFRGSPLLQTVS